MDAKNEGAGHCGGDQAPKNDRLGSAIKSTNNSQTNSTQVELYYGSARSPLARVVPDRLYLTMWRIIWPDGQMSDMTNIARAKDAAMAISERGPPPRNRRRLHWTAKRSNSPPEAPLVRQNNVAATDGWTDWPPSGDAVAR